MTKHEFLRNSLFSYLLIATYCLAALFVDDAKADEQSQQWQMEVGAAQLAIDTAWRDHDIQTLSLIHI